ncbi:MAG: hypothetical protein HFE86_08570 [Clostridiales bacterium]|nr:hypothetical protein [Clostridiales bacterium]
MKRIVASLVAVVLMVAIWLPISVFSNEAEGTDLDGAVSETLPGNGGIEVSFGQAILVKGPVSFNVTLSREDHTTIGNQVVSLSDQPGEKSRRTALFDNLAGGAYILTAEGDGYRTFTQTIDVEEGYTYKLNVNNGFLAGYTYAEKDVHPGVLLAGDLDKNDKVDEADAQLLVDSMDQNSKRDLNGDGVVTLADLQMLAASLKENRDFSATVKPAVSSSMITLKKDENTTVTGELEGLITGENSVTLSPASGGDISAEAPVTLHFDFSQSMKRVEAEGLSLNTGSDSIANGALQVTYEDNGEEVTADVPIQSGDIHFLLASSVQVNKEADGTLVVHFGEKVAVKKVTLTISKMEKNNNLAEISQVEFLNDMESRVPPPTMDIPKNVTATPDSAAFTVTWDRCNNVTGYEVLVSGNTKEGFAQEVKSVSNNTLLVDSISNQKLINGETYTVQVQSTNGDWKSGYADEIQVTPKADKKPDPPDNLSLKGGYLSISASWKKMKDTDFYNLYYREYENGEYTKIADIENNSYTLSDLKNKTKYQVYVTGVNELGESGPSIVSAMETVDITPAKLPVYKLINTSNGAGEKSAHIQEISHYRGEMKDSPLDEAGTKTAWGLVDKNYGSYLQVDDWDEGGSYPSTTKGVRVVFDDAYTLNSFSFQELEDNLGWYGPVTVYYKDASDGNLKPIPSAAITAKLSDNGRRYYTVKWNGPVTTEEIRFGIGRTNGYVRKVVISEVNFYYYDSLEDDIKALYQDEMHTTLKDEVTEATIHELEARLNTPDNEELHPDYQLLKLELETALEILQNNSLGESLKIHTGITAMKDGSRLGFSGLNSWQPLGVTAYAGEQLILYVGHNTKKLGENTNLQLVATQYDAEASAMSQTVTTLKVGRNEVTVPRIQTLDVEAGGALYIQYTGNNANDQYAVRVSGGTAVPILDLYETDDPAERLARASAYVEALDAYAAAINEMHLERHQLQNVDAVHYPYDAQTCILGATDILLDKMLLSLPAQQILSGLGSGTVAQRAQKLVDSMDAMDGMLYLFYQHKGLSDSATSAIDKLPAQHLNIRYQRMFAGAFMYAAGNHIGIGWGSTAGMVTSVPVVSDENGKYVSGRYFGWGVAHEIGHNINQGSYAIAEVTNNYFAVLAQAKDTNDSVRFSYDKVYQKVTSNTTGYPGNVFTQLAMYWQLHLAYDTGYNFKVYDNYEEQLANLFFARVDTYARDTSRAPKAEENGVALTLTGNVDQKLMRLACAAAEKNLLAFFTRWGLTPDEDTTSYASQFPEETRAIYYVNDESRVYAVEHAEQAAENAVTGKDAVGDVTVSVDQQLQNQVTLTLSSQGVVPDAVLGYEIRRSTISGGEEKEEVIGFTTGDTFVDHFSTLNNRVVTYKVAVIDKYLNRSNVKTIESVKIAHDGSLDKSNWTVSTNLVNTEEANTPQDPCEPAEKAISQVIDQDVETAFVGKTASGSEPEVALHFHRALTVTGLKYTVKSGAPITDYEIQISSDGTQWQTLASGTFDAGQQVQTVLFPNADKENPWNASYEAAHLRLIAKGQAGRELTISELDVLGTTGDDVEFSDTSEGQPSIGILREDYTYGTDAGQKIPAGSLVFTGAFKGNPAYNVLMLYDQNGNIVGGLSEDENTLKAEQIILADVPSSGDLGETSDGVWIYWIDPADGVALEQVRAELYRVNDALTNQGQRLVADTQFVTVPAELPYIQFTKS